MSTIVNNSRDERGRLFEHCEQIFTAWVRRMLEGYVFTAVCPSSGRGYPSSLVPGPFWGRGPQGYASCVLAGGLSFITWLIQLFFRRFHCLFCVLKEARVWTVLKTVISSGWHCGYLRQVYFGIYSTVIFEYLTARYKQYLLTNWYTNCSLWRLCLSH